MKLPFGPRIPSTDNGGDDPPDNAWIEWCTEAHLQLLMMIHDRAQRGKPLERDPEYLVQIREQGEAVRERAIELGVDKLSHFERRDWIESIPHPSGKARGYRPMPEDVVRRLVGQDSMGYDPDDDE